MFIITGKTEQPLFTYWLLQTTTNAQKQSLPQNLQLEKAKLNKSISVSESVLPHPLCGRISIIQPTCTFSLYTQVLNTCSTELHQARAGNCWSQRNSPPSVHILGSVALITLSPSFNQKKKPKKTWEFPVPFYCFLVCIFKETYKQM